MDDNLDKQNSSVISEFQKLLIEVSRPGGGPPGSISVGLRTDSSLARNGASRKPGAVQPGRVTGVMTPRSLSRQRSHKLAQWITLLATVTDRHGRAFILTERLFISRDSFLKTKYRGI